MPHKNEEPYLFISSGEPQAEEELCQEILLFKSLVVYLLYIVRVLLICMCVCVPCVFSMPVDIRALAPGITGDCEPLYGC